MDKTHYRNKVLKISDEAYDCLKEKILLLLGEDVSIEDVKKEFSYITEELIGNNVGSKCAGKDLSYAVRYILNDMKVEGLLKSKWYAELGGDPTGQPEELAYSLTEDGDKEYEKLCFEIEYISFREELGISKEEYTNLYLNVFFELGKAMGKEKEYVSDDTLGRKVASIIDNNYGYELTPFVLIEMERKGIVESREFHEPVGDSDKLEVKYRLTDKGYRNYESMLNAFRSEKKRPLSA